MALIVDRWRPGMFVGTFRADTYSIATFTPLYRVVANLIFQDFNESFFDFDMSVSVGLIATKRKKQVISNHQARSKIHC